MQACSRIAKIDDHEQFEIVNRVWTLFKKIKFYYAKYHFLISISKQLSATDFRKDLIYIKNPHITPSVKMMATIKRTRQKEDEEEKNLEKNMALEK